MSKAVYYTLEWHCHNASTTNNQNKTKQQQNMEFRERMPI